MNSPFPGMDPYIEACGLWEGFHSHLIEAIYRDIAPILPRGYVIDTAVRTYVIRLDSADKGALAKPDIAIIEPASGKKTRRNRGGVALANPDDVDSVPMEALHAEEFREPFVEIYAELEERVLVTCIEVLSPTNKRKGTEGYLEYQRKREAMLLGRANFVEIDLLRGGGRLPMLTPWPSSPYALLVSRMPRPARCRAWSAHFDRRLAPIPVPLLAPDPDLSLDLQPLIDGIYALGRYDERIDYDKPLLPRPSRAEALAVRRLLKNRPA